MTAPTNAVAPRNAAGPSLAKLVSHIPAERRWRRQADALIVIGRQLELMAQEQGRTAHVSLGTLRFSLFRMHQGRISQMVPFCQSITVYGEADVAPPDIPGVTFVPVAHGAPMSQEWFLVIDSPGFWGAMIAQASPDRADGAARRYLFEGVLTADERVVSRASLLLSLAGGRGTTDSSSRDATANRVRWAQVAYALATHADSQRLDLLGCIQDLPEMQSLLAMLPQSFNQIAPEAIDVLRRHCGSVGEVLYRVEGNMLEPIAWSCPQRPPTQPVSSGVAGQALLQNQLALTMLQPGDPEHSLLSEANSVAAIPLIVRGMAWGVLLVGQEEYDPEASATTIAAVGVATLLEQIIDADPSAQAQAPAPQAYPASPSFGMPAAPPARPTPGFPAPGFPPSGPSQQPPAMSPPAWPAPYASPTPPAAQPSNFGLPAWMRSTAPPQPAGGASPVAPRPAPAVSSGEEQSLRSWPVLQKRLFTALVAYDQEAAEQVWSETCAIYKPEQICNELLTPVQIEIGNGWHRGEVSVAAEHFSSRFVQSKLLNLFNASSDHPGGMLAIIACAQGELHEIGAIMISLFLRWGGFRVIYLGQNVPNSTIEEMVQQLNPQILGLSAATVTGASGLIAASELIAQLPQPRPFFMYGGLAFRDKEELQARVRGGYNYQGDIRQVAQVLAQKIRGT